MQSSQPSLKVSVFWGDILYDTVLCNQPTKISIGRKPGNTFLLDLNSNSPVESLDLVIVNPDRSVDLQFDETFDGHVRLASQLLTIDAAINRAQAVKQANGVYRVRLTEHDSAELMLGYVSFSVGWVADRQRIAKASPLNRRVVSAWLVFLMLMAPLAYVIHQSYLTFQRDEKPPERLVTVLPKELVQPQKKVEPPPQAPAEAAIGEKKTPDGGAQKGEIGKAELVPPKTPKPEKKTKVAKTPPKGRTTNAPAANATSAAQTIRDANLGSLVQGLATLGAAEAPAAGDRDGYTAPIQQTGTGGFSTEGLKQGGGGKTVGIGRTVGQGEGGFQGTGKLGIAGTTLGAKGTGYGGGRAPSAAGGGLDRDVIDNIVRQRKDRIRLCYERQLNFNPRLSGKITVHFEIDANGKVLSSSLAEDTMKNEAVRQCVLSEVKSWTFPKPQGGVVVPVDYPFVFESSSLGRK